MQTYELAIIGGLSGVTAPTVADLCFLKNKQCLYINCDSEENAATKKGVKLENHIIPKLPFADPKNVDEHNAVLELLAGSVSQLERTSDGTNLYHNPSIGIRQCPLADEREYLESLPIEKAILPPGLVQQMNGFTSDNFSIDINPKLLYAYKERVWNVDAYLSRYVTKLSYWDDVVNAIDVFIQDINGKVIIEITDPSGSKSLVAAEKLLVCMGMGNMEFERTNKVNLGLDPISWRNIKLLQYYKSIKRSGSPFPDLISNLLVPESGICLTNELENRHGLLYNTNDSAIPVSKWNSIDIDVALKTRQEAIRKIYPLVGNDVMKEFMCTMPVCSSGFRIDQTKHFEFIVTPSFEGRVLYFNLTYFSGIGSAILHLQDNFNNIVYG